MTGCRAFTSTTCAARTVTYGALTRMPCHTGGTAHLARGAHLQQPGRDRHTEHLHRNMPAISEPASVQNRMPDRHFNTCGVSARSTGPRLDPTAPRLQTECPNAHIRRATSGRTNTVLGCTPSASCAECPGRTGCCARSSACESARTWWCCWR